MALINGIQPGPNSPAIGLRSCRSEAAEQSLGTDLVLRLGGEHVSLSQQRASGVTIGLPDSRYRVMRVAFWWEWKADDGKLTPSQHDFLVKELQHGALGGCGVYDDLRLYLHVLQEGNIARDPGRIQQHSTVLIASWASRGYRREKPPARRRR